MEALRNYVQHRGIPAHSIQSSMNWTSLEDDDFLGFSIEFSSLRTYLADDKKFKKETLSELDEKIDLKIAVRSYIESISSIHEVAREMIKEDVGLARGKIENAHVRYAEIYKEKLIGLSAYKIQDDKQISNFPLLLDWDDIRIELLKRNSRLINLKKRFVTSIVRPLKK